LDGNILGSVHYMAPEQLARTACDHRADLYSLGCIFYECLSGKRAVEAENVYAIMEKHLNHDIVTLQMTCPHLPLLLIGWLETGLMAQQPDDRYQSAVEALEALMSVDISSNVTGATARKYASTGYQPPIRTSTVAAVEPAPRSLVPWALGGAAVLLGGLWMILGKGGDPIAPAAPVAQVTPAVASAAPPPAVPVPVVAKAASEFPEPGKLCIQLTAEKGVCGFETGIKDGVGIAMEGPPAGQPVLAWHNLAKPNQENNDLRTVKKSEGAAPTWVEWKNTGVKPGGKALQFGKPDLGAAEMILVYGERTGTNFPFTPGCQDGCAAAVVFSLESGVTPQRILRVGGHDTGVFSFFVDEQNQLSVELAVKAQPKERKITIHLPGVPLDEPMAAIMNWGGEPAQVTFSVVTASGKEFTAPPMNYGFFTAPLRAMAIGRLKNFGSEEDAEQKNRFFGKLATFMVYNAPLNDAKLDQLKHHLAETYFTK
jgi:hypothetical protein